MSESPNEPPYLSGVVLGKPLPDDTKDFPFHLPWLKDFDLAINNRVTFFVGENGSGKSTLLETIAALSNLPLGGGSRGELSGGYAPEEHCKLAHYLRPSFRRRPKDGYFFRAEFQAHFASLLDERREDPDFKEDPYQRYGGRSLLTQSHGEAFLQVMTNRYESGLFLLDEPESALSPQRQLTLLALIAKLADAGQSQFLIATHSPILMTYPGATLLGFDEERLHPVELHDLPHYYITRDILENPERYWKHLRPKQE